VTEVPETAPADLDSPQPTPELPGRRLRETREAKGLTVADVAHAIKFGVRQIEALEADDYAVLPGVTFIRGAVRSYAKFLKLDGAALVAMLDAAAPAAPPDVRPPQNMGTAMDAVGIRQLSPLVALSVVLTLLAAVIGVWHFMGGAQPPSVAGETRPPILGKPEVAPAVAVLPPQATTESVPEVQLAPAQNSPPPQTAPALADGRQLLFVFGDRSWIEVKDASQRIIFTGEQSAGSRQTVIGKPPFQLVIGNAAKVQVFDGERQVDIQPFIRAEVARLTLE